MHFKTHMKITRLATQLLGIPKEPAEDIIAASAAPDFKDKGIDRIWSHSFIPGTGLGDAPSVIRDIIAQQEITPKNVGVALHFLQDMSQPFHTSVFGIDPTMRGHRFFERFIEGRFHKLMDDFKPVPIRIDDPFMAARDLAVDSLKKAPGLMAILSKLDVGLAKIEDLDKIARDRLCAATNATLGFLMFANGLNPEGFPINPVEGVEIPKKEVPNLLRRAIQSSDS